MQIPTNHNPHYEDESATILISDKIKIYPNPANDFVTIKGDENINYQVQIFGVYGNLIKQLSFTKQSQIDVSSWTSGLHMIRIENTETKNILTKKFLIRK